MNKRGWRVAVAAGAAAVSLGGFGAAGALQQGDGVSEQTAMSRALEAPGAEHRSDQADAALAANVAAAVERAQLDADATALDEGTGDDVGAQGDGVDSLDTEDSPDTVNSPGTSESPDSADVDDEVTATATEADDGDTPPSEPTPQTVDEADSSPTPDTDDDAAISQSQSDDDGDDTPPTVDDTDGPDTAGDAEDD